MITPQNIFMKKNLIKMDLFHEIENKLGIVTDFSIEHQKGMSIIKYKSDGIEKNIYTTDSSMKNFIQCFLYCATNFNLKKVYDNE